MTGSVKVVAARHARLGSAWVECKKMWELITTHGRLLQGVPLAFEDGEIRISWVKMAEGETIAILIDRARNQVRLYAPLEECKSLAAQHNYELVALRWEGESLLGYMQRLLGLL